jgi:hypothetical protein
MVMKMLLLVPIVALLLTACGGALSIVRGDRMPGEVVVPHEAQTPIARSIAAFTLGMTKEEALMVLASGLQQHSLTALSPDGMRLDSLAALQEGWIAHMPPQAFFTKGFTEGEFADRESNNEITKTFEVSVEFKSETTKSITLNFYHAKLFKIDVIPLTPYNGVRQGLQGQYGVPNTPLRRIDEWIDQTTILRVLKPGLSLHEGVLFYIDRPLYALLRREAAAIKRALVDEEHRRKNALPKQS